MLRLCVIDFGGSWDSYLPLVEFAYNNSYHSSIGMTPFEALYGRKCRTPICWLEAGEKQFVRPEIVQEKTDKVKEIQERLKAAQNRQKSYADKKRRLVEFQVGGHIMLKVSPWKGLSGLRSVGSLAPVASRPNGHDATTSTTDQPRVTVVELPPPQHNVLGGGPEHIPRRNIATSEPIMEEVTSETRMMDRMMQAMNADMAQQQEMFLKLLEDKDTNNRRHKTVAENMIAVGSGGIGNEIPMDRVATMEARQPTKPCSFKTFLSCRPPEFKGNNDPIVCMNWIREMEQAFGTSGCGEGQKDTFGSQMS
ncbi:hypothetical protein L6452_44305 [Arctium lappa]|uniref:Uncharacterized protein n=1 Tax=Arctium lappa TaxID=4217 RepID=A0ACB8XFA6_ARCLA|nr:hypothetical protein L6452_44305 [Arctium lappa]